MSPSGVDAQFELRQVLRGMAADLQAALFAVKPRVVARAVQRLISRDIAEREALVRAEGRKRDDIAIRPDTALDAPSQLQHHARRILVWIFDLDRLVDFEILDIDDALARIIDARERWRCDGWGWHRSRGDCGGCGCGAATEELTTADVDHFIAALHAFPLQLESCCRGCRKCRATAPYTCDRGKFNGLGRCRRPRSPENRTSPEDFRRRFRTHRPCTHKASLLSVDCSTSALPPRANDKQTFRIGR